MDLGKSRVWWIIHYRTSRRDVKIVLRLLVLSLPLWVLTFSDPIAFRDPLATIFPNWTYCNTFILFSVTYKREWLVLITTLLVEFLIYPLVRDRLPSILKRIGIVALCNFVASILLLTLLLVYQFKEMENVWLSEANYILLCLSQGIQIPFLYCAIIELVCAQAPYNTRGFFTGYFMLCIMVSGGIASSLSNTFFAGGNSQLILFGVKSCISVFGLVLYCLLARWYKRRVRDEEYNVQRVVEEVYDRYLSAAAVGN